MVLLPSEEERFFPHSHSLFLINVPPKKLSSKKVCPPAARCAYSPQRSSNFNLTMSDGMAFFSNRAADNE
jgi:hypothetical protein